MATTIASGIIEIVLKGAAEASTALGRMRNIILATVKSADPVGFDRFLWSIERISIYIGRIFIPVIRQLTSFLTKVGDTLGDLTNEQQDTILHFAKVVAGMLAVVVVGGKVVGMLPGLIGLVKLLGSAFLFLWSAAGGPITLAVVAAMAAVAGGVVILAGRTTSFKKLFTDTWDAIKKVWEKTKEAAKPLLDYFVEMFDKLEPTARGFMSEFMDVAKSIVESTQRIVKSLMPLIKAFGDVGIDVLKLGAVFNIFMWKVLAKLIEWIAAATESVMDFFQAITTNSGGIQGVFGEVTDFFKEIWVNIKEVGLAVGELIAEMQPLLGPVWESMAEACRMIVPAIRTVFDFITQLLRNMVAVFSATLGVIAEVLRGNVSPENLIDTFNNEYDAAQARMAQRRADREAERNRPAGAAISNAPPTNNRDTELRLKPSFVGISEAFRQAQTATQGFDVAAQRFQIMRELAGGTNDRLDEIIERVDGIEPGLR